jgi:phage-related holin
MERMPDHHGFEILSIMLTKIQFTVSKVSAGLLAVAAGVLMNSTELIITTYIMMALHAFTGLTLMWRDRRGWSEVKWFKMCMKLLWFPVVIMATQWMQLTNGIDVPIAAIVAGFLAVNEFRGFIDNVGKLTGTDIWNAIADKMEWGKSKENDK